MSELLPVEEAVARAIAGLAPLPIEQIPLADAGGRILAAPLAALRTQPPFAVSSMDGYAVRADDVAQAGAELLQIGSVPAGHHFVGTVGSGETVRIFTGAPLPDGADSVLIQEDTIAFKGGVIAQDAVRRGQNVRPAGLDFREGESFLAAGTRLGMRQLALAAALGHATVPVRRKPVVAILATGDELVLPGESIGPDQIVASTGFGLVPLIRDQGGEAIDLGVVPDDHALQSAAIRAGLARDIDILITLGGASVGEHDIIRDVLVEAGMSLDFWKIAMRPGKPLVFGHLGPVRVLGLPGNPVSSLVCALLFLRPMLDALLGRPEEALEQAELGAALSANDRRQDYLRATLSRRPDGTSVATALPRQDSSMLAIFAAADCLILRPPHAPPAAAGETCLILRLP